MTQGVVCGNCGFSRVSGGLVPGRRELLRPLLLLLLLPLHAAAQTAQPPPFPRPDLSALPPVARSYVLNLQHTLEATLERGPGAAPGELPDGMAMLGRLYHAYELLPAAEETYGRALALDPERAEFHHLRGLARQELGDLAGAAEDFAAAVAARPDLAAAWLHRGDVLLALGRPEAAAEVFARAGEHGAPRATTAFGLGRAAAAAGDHAAAVEHLESALSLQPSATVVHTHLADAYAAQGDGEKARQHRARAGDGPFSVPDPVAGEVRRVQVHTAFETMREMAGRRDGFDEAEFLGYVQLRLGSAPGIVDRLRAVLAELDAADGAATERGRLHFALANLLLQQGRRDEATAELATAVELAPALREARLQLGDALALAGRLDAAEAHFDALLALDPDHGEALARRAAVRVGLGREGDARDDLERALEVAGDARTRATAHALLARLELRHGRVATAVAHFRLAVDADPRDAAALQGLAMALGRQGRYREAAATFRRLVDLDPDHADARDGEAVALILAGDEAAARRRLDEAVTALPEDARLRGRLARLLAASSDPELRDGERAVALAREVFAVDPSVETVETLAMAYAEAGRGEEAVRWQRRLLASGAATGEQADTERIETWRRNLERYEAGLSCCAPSTDDEERGDPEP